MDKSEWKDVRQKLKEEWNNLWNQRFDDKFQGESIANLDYNMLSIDKGTVIHAPRDAHIPSFREILKSWSEKYRFRDYFVDPKVGGWKKFTRDEITKGPISRKKSNHFKPYSKRIQHQKKGGRGWLRIH